MNFEVLKDCKQILNALGSTSDKLDDLCELEALRRRDKLSERQVDRLIELLTEYHDVVSCI